MGDCPPSAAKPASIRVLRLVATIPPTEADFIPKQQPHPDDEEEQLCRKKGLSVFLRLRDAKQVRKRPGAMREYRIAAVNLTPSHGMLLQHRVRPQTTSSHYTWWIPDGVDPCSLEYVDAEVGP